MHTLLNALHAPRRREILGLIWKRERCAGEIHQALGEITRGALSQHLKILKCARLVECRPVGPRRYYRARPEELGALRGWLESTWDSSLARLQQRAEAEAARRGPRRAKRRSR